MRKGLIDVPASQIVFIILVAVFMTSVIYVILSHTQMKIKAKTSEKEMIATSLAHIVSTNKNITRNGIFLASEMDKFNGKALENVSLCDYTYEIDIYDLNVSDTKPRWIFKDFHTSSPNYVEAWVPIIIEDGGHRPGIMYIKLYDEYIRKLSCAFKTALYTDYSSLPAVCTSTSKDTCFVKIEKSGNKICFGGECEEIQRIDEIYDDNNIVFDDSFPLGSPMSLIIYRKSDGKLHLKLKKFIGEKRI